MIKRVCCHQALQAEEEVEHLAEDLYIEERRRGLKKIGKLLYIREIFVDELGLDKTHKHEKNFSK